MDLLQPKLKNIEVRSPLNKLVVACLRLEKLQPTPITSTRKATVNVCVAIPSGIWVMERCKAVVSSNGPLGLFVMFQKTSQFSILQTNVSCCRRRSLRKIDTSNFRNSLIISCEECLKAVLIGALVRFSVDS